MLVSYEGVISQQNRVVISAIILLFNYNSALLPMIRNNNNPQYLWLDGPKAYKNWK